MIAEETMETILLNDALTLAFPEGFRRLSDAETDQLRGGKSAPGLCLRDDARHIVVSLGHKQAGLLSVLLNGKDIVKGSQTRIAGAMRGFGYQLAGYDSRAVGGKTAPCFRYAYTAQNTEMLGECCAFKAGKTHYFLHFYVRRACAEEGLLVWKKVLEEAKWS